MASPFKDQFQEAQGYFDPGDALGQQGERDAQDALNKRYDEMRKNYQAYRPQLAQGGTNALQTQLGAFGPLNDLMQRMYGGGAGFDLAALGKNPLEGAFDQRTAAQKLFGQFQDGQPSADNLVGDQPLAPDWYKGDAAGLAQAGAPPVQSGPTPPPWDPASRSSNYVAPPPAPPRAAPTPVARPAVSTPSYQRGGRGGTGR